jgi:hypothetical protein
MAHDRIHALWKLAGWARPETVTSLRGNGKAAADPDGVRGFTDAKLDELRARILRSRRLTAEDPVAWDCVVCFGLRPAELTGAGTPPRRWRSGGQGHVSSAKIIAVRNTGTRSGKSVDETHYKVAATRQTTKPAGTQESRRGLLPTR